MIAGIREYAALPARGFAPIASFVLTAVFGAVLFHDTLSAGRIAGIAAIVVGVYLVGRS